MGRRGVARVDRPFVYIELRLVGDVAHRACLRTGAVQSSLRAFQHLDSRQIRRIYVEIAPEKLYRLIIEIDRHIGEGTGSTDHLAALVRGCQAPHVHLVLSRSNTRGRYIGQILYKVFQRLGVELAQRCVGQGGDGDRHVLKVLASAGRSDHHLFELVARGGLRQTRTGTTQSERHSNCPR